MPPTYVENPPFVNLNVPKEAIGFDGFSTSNSSQSREGSRALRIHLHRQRELHVPRVPQQELQRVVREAVASAKVHEGILGDFRGKLRQLS